MKLEFKNRASTGPSITTFNQLNILLFPYSLPNLYSCGSPSDNSDNSSNISSNHNESNSPTIGHYIINDEIIKLNANNHEVLNRMSSYGPPKPPRDPSRLTSTNLQRISATNTGGANDESLIGKKHALKRI